MNNRDLKSFLITFKEWYDKLSPAEKCTVWPTAGSGSGTGLYNMSDEDLVDKYLTKLKKEADAKRIICPQKVNGSCPLPNVHCNYPECEQPKN